MSAPQPQIPTNFETPTVVQPQQESLWTEGYVSSFKGILKLLEIGTSLIVIITSSVWISNFFNAGGGWVHFVSIAGFYFTTLFFMIYALGLVAKIRNYYFSFDFFEMDFNVMFVIFYFISGVVASVYGSGHPSVGASAAFCFFAMFPYAIDAYYSYQTWQSPTSPPLPTQMPVPRQQMPGQTPAQPVNNEQTVPQNVY